MIRTTVKIEGMMCGMCEAHLNDAIRSAFPVKKVSSSHAKGEAVILSEAPLDGEKLRQIVDATGYVFVSAAEESEEKKGLSQDCSANEKGMYMKPDYKNWMPKGMVYSFLFAALGCSAAALAVRFLPAGALRTVLTVAFVALAVIFCGMTVWAVCMYRAFDYNGKRQMSRQIIEDVAAQVKLPEGGRCLDVGCGSGALAIAVGKRNPEAEIVGIDRWGKEYASFSKTLCERNAGAEGVTRISFRQGDATHLDFPDETFDAVVSNYVYHNIPGKVALPSGQSYSSSKSWNGTPRIKDSRRATARQQYLLETLRTLKKGGTFALHDIFSKAKYGDMQAFVRKLRDMGYQRVELIDTTDGWFMKKSEAAWMGLSGSALLTGVK